MDLSRVIEHWAQHAPGRIALRFQGRDMELRRSSGSASRQATRALGVGRGERIAWLGYNHPDMLALLFAAARLGAILVPLNWRLAAAEHAAILRDCVPRRIYSDAGVRTAGPRARRAAGGLARQGRGAGKRAATRTTC